MGNIVDFFHFGDDTFNQCITAGTCDYWRLPIPKKVFGKCTCPSDIVLKWIGKPIRDKQGSFICGDLSVVTLEEYAGSIDYVECEKYASYSFIITGDLQGKTVAFNVEGSNYWQYTGVTNELGDLQMHLENFPEILKVERENSLFTLTLCKDMCGQGISAFEGYNPKGLQLINVISVCKQITCCCSDMFFSNIVFPSIEGCYILQVFNKKTNELIIESTPIKVSKSELIRPSCVVSYRNATLPIAGLKNSKQYIQVRLPLHIRDDGRTVSEEIKTLSNGDFERKSINIHHQFKFTSAPLPSYAHDYILGVLKSNELYVNGKKVFYQGGYNETKAYKDLFVSNGILTQIGENIYSESCSGNCDSRTYSLVEMNDNINNLSIYVHNVNSGVFEELRDKSYLEEGQYKLSIRNDEPLASIVKIYVNEELKFEKEVLKKCTFDFCVKPCQKIRIEKSLNICVN
jgi:hypothetical protein